MTKEQKKFLNPLDFVLLYDNVLVEQYIIEDIDDTGMVRPQNYEDKPEIGRVLSVGKGRLFDNGVVVPLDVKVGDIIYFNKYSSVKVRLDTKDFYIIHEEDVQGYLR
jgi:chaperonin GroES